MDLERRFEKLREIGKGAFARVHLCKDRASGKAVAVKIVELDKSRDRIETYQKEVALMAQCRSPFVVSYLGSFVVHSDIYIVMEYLPPGSVLRIMRRQGPLPESSCALVLHDTLEGLAYLHGEGHVHMDIKPGNILLSMEGRGKLCDLGVAKGLPPAQRADAAAPAEAAKPSKMAGTLLYMSPEMVTQAPVACNTDIWSLGITAIEIATGRVPRGDVHQMKAIYMTAHHLPPALEGKFASSFKDFVAQCLVKDPKLRPQAAQLLKHKFVKGVTKCSKLVKMIRKSLESDSPPSSSDEEDDDRHDRRSFSSNEEEYWDFAAS